MVMPCIFAECPNPGLYTLGIRLRRPNDNLTAIWAPETGALVCDYHARRGMTITIQLGLNACTGNRNDRPRCHDTAHANSELPLIGIFYNCTEPVLVYTSI